MSTVHAARPETAGSWRFDIREARTGGERVARVHLAQWTREGSIRVGEIPFGLKREGMGRTYRLLFEGRAMARAEPEGPLSNTLDIRVERGLLEAGAEIGDLARFAWVPKNLSGTAYDLRTGGETVGSIRKTSVLFRRFSLRFDREIPLVIRAFCLALLLARLRQSSGG